MDREPRPGLTEVREILAGLLTEAAARPEGVSVKSVFRSRTMAGLLIAWAGAHAEPLLALAPLVTDPAQLAREIVTIGVVVAGYGRVTAKGGLK